ncbi:MAG: CDP-diacylglycerol--glycerol-3-phosphate 3-phosphatidyltransferase [Treponema sp.]|nr:CDP-diacylglycerol--glycerol-3-phosphate 3-phosphatidyltransferase [Treponema sp.]
MKAADIVTTIRILLAPVFFVVCNFYVLFNPAGSDAIGQFWQIPVLWIIFAIAELSDMLDGLIARKLGEVSDFGKLYDPFADTLFQISIFICFVWHNILPIIPFLLIVYREFAILFIRNLMQKKGISMGARLGGKIKTVVSIGAGVLALVVYSLRILFQRFLVSGKTDLYDRLYTGFSRSAIIVFHLAVVLSILSFIDYFSVYLKNPKQ